MQHLRNLRALSFAHCGLQTVDPFGDLSGFQNLVSLDLSNNHLQYLPIALLDEMPMLSELNISNNKFKTFPYLRRRAISVNIENNPLECSCTNVGLEQAATFRTTGFNCQLAPCPYFLEFSATHQNSSIIASVAGTFKIYCNVSASTSVRFGVYSPIGFIPGPKWDPSTGDLQSVTYQYSVMPIQHPVKLTVQRTSQHSIELTMHYVRGHHAGVWQCAALSDGGLLLDNHTTTIAIETGVDHLFLATLVFGLIVMGSALLLGILIGSLRYLIETSCFRKRQSHKYVGRPLIGVIPVPPPQAKGSAFVENISLNQRICSQCLMQPCFFCGYCLEIHAFSEFEILPESESPSQAPPTYERKRSVSKCYVSVPPLLSSDRSPAPERETEDPSSSTENPVEPEIMAQAVASRELNYDFPSEFCHCVHLDMRFNGDTDGETSTLRDVKLIFSDEQLAQEYTEALEELQAAANSNDTASFRDQLEEFRAKLVHDVGAGVRIAREEIVALKERSAKSVAYLKDQSGAVAQKMKAGFSQVKDGMRSMAEMCGGVASSSAETPAPLGGSITGETIGQSISVVSIYRDEETKEPKERCVSNFQF